MCVVLRFQCFLRAVRLRCPFSRHGIRRGPSKTWCPPSMLRCHILDTTHLTQKTNAAAPDRLSLGRPHLPWCGRPCCRPWQDAPPDVRPSGQPAAAFHPSFGCSPPLHPSFLSSPLSSNPPGPLTLLPDNPPNLPARRATHVSLTFRSSDSPNLPTAVSNRRPQACVRRMQRRRLHNRTS